MQFQIRAYLDKITKYQKPIEVFLVIALIQIIVCKWVFNFVLWPDSTNYLTAAMNFSNHGTLFVYSNGFGRSNLPEIELYSDQAPGYPIFLSIFTFLFNDPMTAATIAHSLTLAIFVILIYKITLTLNFSPLMRIGSLIFFITSTAYRDLYYGLLSEILYLNVCLALFLITTNLNKKNTSKSIWFWAYFLIFIGSSIRFNGLAIAALLFFPLLQLQKYSEKILYGILAIASACAPNIIWFSRNYFLLKTTTVTHNSSSFLWKKIGVPFEHAVYRWGLGSFWVLLFFIIIATLPIFYQRIRKSLNSTNYYTLWIAGCAQFLVIYILSLYIDDISPLEDRLLSGCFTFFVLAFLYSIHAILNTFRITNKISHSAIALLIFLPPVIHMAFKRRPFTFFSHVNYPVEQNFWKIIKAREYVKRASHFYSDSNFLHQIFSGFPQRMVWDSTVTGSPETIGELWKIGENPFFVVNEGSLLHHFIQENFENTITNLKKEKIDQFIVYYR